MPGVFVQLNEENTNPNWKPIGYLIGEGGCWEWVGAKNDKGYGQIRIAGKWRYAHRVMYERTKGAIPEGRRWVIDHLCRNKSCVNPDHLEAVVQQENIARGLKGRLCTHCPRGHEYTPENTYRFRGTGTKKCRECSRIRDRQTNRRLT